MNNLGEVRKGRCIACKDVFQREELEGVNGWLYCEGCKP